MDISFARSAFSPGITDVEARADVIYERGLPIFIGATRQSVQAAIEHGDSSRGSPCKTMTMVTAWSERERWGW
jgi:hypothetical protein